jgi:hypothetical protein
MVTAGALQGMNTAMAGAGNAGASTTTAASGQSGAAASGVNGLATSQITSQTANAFTQNLTRNLTNNLAGAVVDSAINNKPLNADTLANALKSSLITSGMASGANAIGDAAANGDINAFTQKVAHAVLGCAGGAASTGNAAGCAPGATGAVVGEMAADYYMSNKQDPKLSAEQNKANALAFAKVVSAASGIVAGGGGDNVAAVNVAGTTGANAAQNNRLLHPSEVQKAKELAAKSKGRYKQEEIEDALRNASDSATGENITTGMVIKNPADPKAITDKGAVFNAGGDGKSLVQVLPNGGNVDPELAGYIQKNAPNYAWSNEQLGKVSPVQADPNAAIKMQVDPNWSYMGANSSGLAPGVQTDNRAQSAIDKSLNDTTKAIVILPVAIGATLVAPEAALVSGAINTGAQLIKGEGFSPTEALVSTTMGPIGAAATETQAVQALINQGGKAAIAANAAIGAATNVVGDTATKVITGQSVTVENIAVKAVTGAAGANVFNGVKTIPEIATETLNSIADKALENKDDEVKK